MTVDDDSVVGKIIGKILKFIYFKITIFFYSRNFMYVIKFILIVKDFYLIVVFVHRKFFIMRSIGGNCLKFQGGVEG